MGKLRKIGRKIKKGVKKLFSSKIGRIVGMVGLYFAMGAAVKGLSNWFSSSFGKAGAAATETTAVATEGAAVTGGGTGAGAGATGGGAGAGGSKTIGSVAEGAATTSEATNAVIASVDSAAINGSTTANSTITDAVTDVAESNILDQSVAEVNNNLVLKENMVGSDMLAENTIKPELNFMEGASKDVTQLSEQVDLTPPIGELEGFDKVRQASSNVRRGAREYFIGDESTFIPDTISGVGTGLIAQQFAPDEEPMGGGYIAPQPVQVQAQAAYVQDVGPMVANVTGNTNFSNMTQMANQTVYGVGTLNHLAGLYTPPAIPKVAV